MYEGATTRVWRLVAGSRVLEAFNDRGLATAIVTHDDGNRGEELYHGDRFVVKRPNAAYCKLVQTSHGRQDEDEPSATSWSESNKVN